MVADEMTFIPFQNRFLDASDVSQVIYSGRWVTVFTRSEPFKNEFKFNLEQDATSAAALLVERLNNSVQDTNNQNERHSEIMIKLSELAGQLESIEQKQDEADAEIRGRFDELAAEIAELKKQIGDDNLPPAAEAALGRVLAKAQALADIVPNPPPQPQ